MTAILMEAIGHATETKNGEVLRSTFTTKWNASQFTNQEILRMGRYVGIACWLALLIVTEIFACHHPESVAAAFIPFVVLIYAADTFQVIYRLHRDSEAETAHRWASAFCTALMSIPATPRSAT